MVASAGGKVLIYVSKRYGTFDFPQHHMKICWLCFAEDAPFKNFLPFYHIAIWEMEWYLSVFFVKF